MEGFEGEYQDLLCDRNPVESGEDGGARDAEPGVGEDACCRVPDDPQPMNGGIGEADK